MISYINYHVAKIGRDYTPSVIQITGRKTNFPAIKSEKNNIHNFDDRANQEVGVFSKKAYICVGIINKNMEENIVRIQTIQQFNDMKGVVTLHPLVTAFDQSGTKLLGDTSHTYGFYCLFLKESDCGDLIYGRQSYDYQEGSIVSIAPGQIIRAVRHNKEYEPTGWALAFHPDLIRGTSLGKNIKKYTFFSYQANEALHLSDDEKQTVLNLLRLIRSELQQPADRHSQTIICNNIELLLNHFSRFYERQFLVRKAANKEVIAKFESLLDDYYKENKQYKNGLPTVKYCANELYLSSNYFGDLIKRETGTTAQEYVQVYVMDRAKELILGHELSITQIAYELGFEYPTHFSRQFKKLEKCTPSQYRAAH